MFTKIALGTALVGAALGLAPQAGAESVGQAFLSKVHNDGIVGVDWALLYKADYVCHELAQGENTAQIAAEFQAANPMPIEYANRFVHDVATIYYPVMGDQYWPGVTDTPAGGGSG